ncbi:tetratricopeptide repeat protein [Pseudanabaena sp. UWO310]|uniref:tetratricopeptide repeat protein n=1 Tax=Pseudanabaena sp. UWO310 TaxID=2480795 RepID=UPI001157D084|nr:tetratricopeptide repeat protein [Pseudanabaena sp. UWO310]TYQ31975.1 tetratricopeptide repeat protein [Pseudanabaena sp. UWO310]
MSGVAQRVDESVESTPEDEYKSLLRSLRRRKGFGLAFVRCSPAGGVELIKKVRDDLPQKQVGVLELQAPIDNLIERVESFPNQENLNILFVVGLEKSLEEYIRSGYGGEGDYYNLDEIPPILNHLNWQRENFRDKFRHICFVFLLPQFAIKYIIRRAPDFYDWASGKFDIPTQSATLNAELSKIINDTDFTEYLAWNPQQRKIRIIEINELLSEPCQTADNQQALLFEQGNIFFAGQQYDNAIDSYDRVLAIKPDDHEAWYNRGSALSNLGREEEAIASYDKALAIKPDDHEAWHNRGSALGNLGREEEAITSYDEALKLKPDLHEAWYNRGIALMRLGRNEEAIVSYDKSLYLNPNLHEAWYYRGIVLNDLGKREEAIASYDKSLAITPKVYEVWFIRGLALEDLGRKKEALESYDKALAIQEDDPKVWLVRGYILEELGRSKESLISYQQAANITIIPDDHESFNNRGIALRKLGRYKEALESFDKALATNPDFDTALINRSIVLRKILLQNFIQDAKKFISRLFAR